MITDYAIKYALKHVFHDSHEEFADSLGFSNGEYNAMQKRISEGNDSPKLVYATLEKLSSMPERMREMSELYMIESGLPVPNFKPCSYHSDLDQYFSITIDRAPCSAHERRVSLMNECGREYAHSMEFTLCGQNSDQYPACIYYNGTDTSPERVVSARKRPCYLLKELAVEVQESMKCPAKR